MDAKGRLKVPNVFRTRIQEHYGTDLYLTSVTGDFVRIYPMVVWEALEERLARVPANHPSRVRFYDRISYYGHDAELDSQGRVLVHPDLRESAAMIGAVDVFGHYDYLDVWNHDRFLAKLKREPFSDDDARALAGFGI
jgi:MraZ protein